MKKLGFTLAEVLIVIGIIGVVAQMTIPTLMNNIQDKQYKVQYKKTYSVLSSVVERLASDNGGTLATAVATCGAGDSTCLRDLFKNYLAFITSCDSGNVEGVCFPSYGNIKYLNGSFITSGWALPHLNTATALILKDGSSVVFKLDYPTCNYNGYSPYSDYCGWITIDVNGLKPPNTWGKDIYTLFMFSQLLRASVYNRDSSGQPGDDCGVATNYGQSCASKYLTQ